MGATSEGAWYSAAARLRGIDSNLDSMYEGAQTARLQAQVAQLLREVVNPKHVVDRLVVRATELREIRNYGLHPREEADEMERYFTPEECGLLFLTTADYLKQLSVALVRLVESKGRG